MSSFFIQTNASTIYKLDSTREIKATHSGVLSMSPVQDGSPVSDHYFNQNKTLSFSGRISSVKSFQNPDNLTPKDYIEGLLRLKENIEPFTVTYSDTLDSLTNCVFTSLVITQNSVVGNAFPDVNAFDVTFTVKQIRFGTAAVITNQRADSIFNSWGREEESSETTEEVTEPSDADLVRQGAAQVSRAGAVRVGGQE